MLRRLGSEESGLTLVELLGVAVIITVLSLMAVQVYNEVLDRARWAKSRDELRTVEMALELYRTEQGHYPDRLDALVDDGYLTRGVTFQTPWGSAKSRQYYFYTVDDAKKGNSMAYAVGDPGPNCSKTPVLNADATQPLPCGRSPKSKAYSFFQNADLQLAGSGPEMAKGHATLRAFRTSCQSNQESTVRVWSGCDLKTES